MSEELNIPEAQPAQPAAKKATTMVCIGFEKHPCGVTFERVSGNNKRCLSCRTNADMLRTYDREKTAKSRERKAAREEAASFEAASTVEIKKADALEILKERGIVNSQVAKTLFELAEVAAQAHHLTLNDFLFRHGIQATLAARADEDYVPPEPLEDGQVIGELSTCRELQAIWDLSIAWRADAVDFAEFLRIRKLCKTDAYELGLLLGKDFEQCQKNWAEFLPRFNPDNLRANYTQKEMREWLDSTNAVKDYLLLASRNSMKSSFSLVWLLGLHLCCPDARALLISETQKLSAGFIRSYRSYWERKPNQETVLTKFFPEYCTAPGEGSTKTFASPMAHLALIQSSAEATSADSAVTGGRAEILIFDDVISNLTCSTEDQRKKSVDAFDLLQKLREVLGSFSITIGTPWFAEEDLYAVLLKRNAADENKSLRFRIDPVVTLIPTARHKLTPSLLPTLLETDAESFLLPVRMPWRFIKKEIGANPVFALSQNFCIFPTAQDADLRVQFSEDVIRNHIRSANFFDGGINQVVMSFDRAYSVSQYSDLSAAVIGKIATRDSKTVLIITEVVMDRMRESDIVVCLLKLIEKHKPTRFVCEKDKSWEELWTALRKGAAQRNIVLPNFIWRAIDTTARSKAKRAKRLELPFFQDRLWFLAGAWCDAVVEQFVKYNGVHSSNSHRKDDAIDGISLLYDSFMPRTLDEPKPSEKEIEQRKREAEDATRVEIRQQNYNRYFGADYAPPPPPSTAAPQKPTDPRLAVFGKNGPWRM